MGEAPVMVVRLRVPALTVVIPLWVLAAESLSAAVPVLVKPLVPAIWLLNVRVLPEATLTCGAEPLSVTMPPLKVGLPSATVMPGVETVPETVTV